MEGGNTNLKDKNICKFVPSKDYDRLEVVNFIYETNFALMQEGKHWKAHSMILIVQGEGIINVNDMKVPFVPGSLVFCFRGDDFCVSAQNPVEYMYISFNGARAEELFRRFGINSSCRSYRGFEGIIPMWKSSLSRTAEANIDLAAESILLYTFSKFDVSHAEGNELVNHIVELTEAHFTDSDTSIGAIAEELGYNYKYISHLFKEKMGISYSEYLRNLRIEYAVSLFDHGIDSVKNVAFLSGFKDPLYFSTVFKKAVGISPKDYKSKENKGIFLPEAVRVAVKK